MKINQKKFLVILTLSLCTGLVFNFFNPSGIPLIREKLALEWADDSLFSIGDSSETIHISDTIQSASNSKIENTQIKPNEKVVIEKSESIVNNEQKTNTESSPQKESKVETFTEPKAITLNQAYSLYNENHIFIDARESVDFEEGHIAGAINIPFYQFDENKHKLDNISFDNPVVTYCSGTDCDLSILLSNQLSEMGYKKVFIFFGGWPEWIDANYPVTLKKLDSEEL